MFELKEFVKESLKSILHESLAENSTQDQVIVGENGLNFLRNKIEELNRRALRWNLPPLELKIVKEEFVDRGWADGPNVKHKQCTVIITGEAPVVKGYEFIAKIEHTDAGNLINMAPRSSVKHLPAEYKTGKADCDMCHQNRERFNTFILKNVDTDKLIKAGSGCLKRFLPAASVTALINYAQMLEEIREELKDNGDLDQDYDAYGRPDRFGNYWPVSQMLTALCIAYLVKGKYIGKTTADSSGTTSTVDMAKELLLPPKREFRGELHDKAREKEPAGDALAQKIMEWAKNFDFDTQAITNPDYATLYHNLQVLSQSEYANLKNLGYLGAMLAQYMRIHGETVNAAKKPSEYVGTVGSKINNIDVTLLFQRTFSGAYGDTFLYSFQDASGNRFAWFSSKNLNLVDPAQYKIVSGAVK
jgi:hypothetical protein